MALSDFEELKINEFINVTGFGWQPPVLTANFGGGYGAGAVVSAYGLRRWTLEADLLPDFDEYLIEYDTLDDDGLELPRFSYFLDFFQRHLMLGNKPFIIRDPRTQKKYLVAFPDSVAQSGIDFQQMTAKVLSGGTSLVERRAAGIAFNDDGSIDLDYTPPTGSLSVSQNDGLYKDTVTITATVSDNVAIAKVRFYIDYELLSEDLSAPYTASWDTRLHKNGSRRVWARVYDTSGLVTVISTYVAVVNDHTDPMVTISSPSPGATVTGTFTATATASDNVAIDRVEWFYYDGEGFAPFHTDSSAPYTADFDSTSVANGDLILAVTAFDTSGNSAVAFLTVNAENVIVPPDPPEGLRLTVLPDGSIRADWDWDAATPAPTVPVMTAATGITDTIIHWNWNASTSDAPITGYDIEIAENSGFTVGLRTINLGNVLTYVDTGRTAETQYFARVRANDEVPHSSAYSSSVDATTTEPAFAPTDVADLWVWLEPTDFLTQSLADGDNIALWNDSSGNNRDATQSGAAEPICKISIINGFPVARFAGGVYHFFDLPDMSALTEGEVFIVLKANAQPSVSFAKSGLGILGGGGSLYTYNGDGKIYDHFGSTIRRDAITPSVDTSDGFHIYSAFSKTNDWENFLDGVSQLASGTNTVSFPASPALGCDTVGNANFDGDIAEFIFFSRKLTSPERADIITYLTDKFGI